MLPGRRWGAELQSQFGLELAVCQGKRYVLWVTDGGRARLMSQVNLEFWLPMSLSRWDREYKCGPDTGIPLQLQLPMSS